MCKIGILLIGLDLYHSSSTIFHQLILHTTTTTSKTADNNTNNSNSQLLIDLIVHLIALMTLLLAYRGRLKRSIAGKVVLPVMMVNGFKQLLVGHFVTFANTTALGENSSNNEQQQQQQLQWSFFDNTTATNHERLMVLKTILFCGVMVRLAFQGDDSCVGPDEWFPWQMGGCYCKEEEENGNDDDDDNGVVVEEKKETKKKE